MFKFLLVSFLVFKLEMDLFDQEEIHDVEGLMSKTTDIVLESSKRTCRVCRKGSVE